MIHKIFSESSIKMPSSVLLYQIVVIVPLVYIVIVMSMVKNIDMKENENNVKDHVVRSEKGEEVNEIVESLDNNVADQELEIIFVRSRSKLNERQRANYDDE